MAVYVIAFLEVTDTEAFEAYRTAGIPTLAPYGGRVLTTTSSIEVLEGVLHPKFAALVEFDSIEQARKWYASPEYAGMISMRQRAANSNVVIVGG